MADAGGMGGGLGRGVCVCGVSGGAVLYGDGWLGESGGAVLNGDGLEGDTCRNVCRIFSPIFSNCFRWPQSNKKNPGAFEYIR